MQIKGLFAAILVSALTAPACMHSGLAPGKTGAEAAGVNMQLVKDQKF